MGSYDMSGEDVSPMNKTFVSLGIPAVFAVAGILAIAQWMRQVAALPAEEPRLPIVQRPMIVTSAGPAAPAPAVPVQASVPTPTAPTTPAPVAAPAAQPTQGAEVAFEVLPGNWPCFRGPDLDNVSKEQVKLNRDWVKNPPRELWAVNDLGEGYAAPAVEGGRVFLVDYDQAGKKDNVRCFSLADGKPLWNYAYLVEVKRNHGMSRTIPAVASNRVVTLGPMCHVNCFEASTGRRLWGTDLVKDYQATIPEWYAGQCPLIEDGNVILAPGGSNVLMMAVSAADGKTVWATPNLRGWAMSHASILPHVFKGRRMYVYVCRGGITAVDALNGKVLWEFADWPKIIADVPTPVSMGEDKLFVARAYEQGSLILQLKEVNGVYSIAVVAKLPRKVFGSDQQTPVFYGGHLYGARPPRGELVCLDPEGNQKWASGVAGRFGIGPYMIADGMILVMDDNGTMTLAAASPDGYREITKRKLLEGHETWGPIALAGGRMLVRDMGTERPNSSRLVCLDVSAK